jgi:GIY-YIG catalytic domain
MWLDRSLRDQEKERMGVCGLRQEIQSAEAEGYRRMTIYLIQNSINGKWYIGKTVQTVARRWARHISGALARGDRTPLAFAIRKYRPDAFSVNTLLEVKTPFELTVAEILAIGLLRCLSPARSSYNATAGGDGFAYGNQYGNRLGPGRGWKLSKTICARISAGHLGRKRPDVSKRNVLLHTGTQRSTQAITNIARGRWGVR